MVEMVAGLAVAVLTTGVLTFVLRRRPLLAGVAGLYLGAVAALTLPLRFPAGDAAPWYETANFVPLAGIDTYTFERDIWMTVPLGLLLPLR